MKLHTAAAIGLLGLALGGAGGCVAVALGVGAAAGIGTYAYVEGELTDTEEVPLDKGYAAAQAAVKDLQFAPKEDSKDALQARIVATEPDQTEIKITLESKGDKLTKFGIRVGLFGDESKSRLIMDTIKKHL